MVRMGLSIERCLIKREWRKVRMARMGVNNF